MSTTDATTDLGSNGLGAEPNISVDLGLQEAQALRAWLLKASVDGATSLDDPLVDAALTKLGRAVDTAAAIENVRRELEQAGLDVDRLSDEDVRDLGRRISDAAGPAFRA
jgi:hypothetical protein